MPVNKGLNADFRVWKTFEVRYSAAKKNGISGCAYCIFAYSEARWHLSMDKLHFSLDG